MSCQSESCGCREQSTPAPSPGWKPCPWRPVFWAELNTELALIADMLRAQDRKITQLARVVRQLEGITMASQADIDALAAALHQEDSDLNSAVSAITAKIADLQAQIDAGQPVDLSGLQAEVDGLRGAVDSAAALVPAPAA
jgi:chromosome segregation ATPase